MPAVALTMMCLSVPPVNWISDTPAYDVQTAPWYTLTPSRWSAVTVGGTCVLLEYHVKLGEEGREGLMWGLGWKGKGWR